MGVGGNQRHTAWARVRAAPGSQDMQARGDREAKGTRTCREVKMINFIKHHKRSVTEAGKHTLGFRKVQVVTSMRANSAEWRSKIRLD